MYHTSIEKSPAVQLLAPLPNASLLNRAASPEVSECDVLQSSARSSKPVVSFDHDLAALPALMNDAAAEFANGPAISRRNGGGQPLLQRQEDAAGLAEDPQKKGRRRRKRCPGSIQGLSTQLAVHYLTMMEGKKPGELLDQYMHITCTDSKNEPACEVTFEGDDKNEKLTVKVVHILDKKAASLQLIKPDRKKVCDYQWSCDKAEVLNIKELRCDPFDNPYD